MNLNKLSLAVILTASTSHGATVWTDDFAAYNDGDPITGSTATGDGTYQNNQNVAANAAGQVLLTADTGRDAIQVNSSTQASCGQLSFDVAFLGDTVTPPDTDIFFLQLTEGGRSTNAAPVPGFAHTFDAGALGISTISTSPSSVNYFFNGSGSVFNYTAPDGSTQALASGTYDIWVDTTQEGNGLSNTTNGTATPGFVTTWVAQTFNGQEGESFIFDNIEMQEFNADHIPEPSSTAILALGLLAFVSKRRR